MELNKHFTFTEPQGTISEAGIAAIQELIRMQRADSEDWAAINPANTTGYYVPALPDDWGWIWVTQHGDYRGTFPKRVSQYIFKMRGLKAPKSFLESLGNIAKAHSAAAITYDFEIVDQITWTDGEFGDRGSCWWGGHSDAKDMLIDNGGLAIRFYHIGTDMGLGRAWLVPVDDYHIIFNGYGFEGNSTLRIARIFASWRGEFYKRINLSNYGSTGNTLYINGGLGYAIGDMDRVTRIYSHDFQWGDDNSILCYRCEDHIHEDDAHSGLDHNLYCRDCYDETFSYCDICGRDRWADEVTYMDDHQAVCDRCRDSHYTLCAECDQEYPNSDIREFNDKSYCENCYNEVVPQPKTK